MPAPPKPPNEKIRLAAVQQLNMMGTPAEERFDKITRLARHLFNVPMVALNIVGDNYTWLKSTQGFDALDGPREESYCTYTVLTKGICLVPDARSDSRVCDSPHAKNWVFYAGSPVYFKGEPIGALCVGDVVPREFSEEHYSALTDLASLVEREFEISMLSEAQSNLAAKDEESEKKNKLDVLTHFWNHDAILALLATEITNRGVDVNLSLLMVDLDYYKRIGDTYGQETGNQALKEAAERIRKVITPKNAIGRIDSDRFLIILTDKTQVEAIELAKLCCQLIASKAFTCTEHKFMLTCSVGVTLYHNHEAIDMCLQRSEQALLLAKENGRNRVEFKN